MWNSLKCSCTKTKYFPFTTITTVITTEWYDTQYTIITHWHIFKQNSLSFISDTSWAVYVDTYYIFFFALSWYSLKLLNCSLRVQIAKLLPFKSLPFFKNLFFIKRGFINHLVHKICDYINSPCWYCLLHVKTEVCRLIHNSLTNIKKYCFAL